VKPFSYETSFRYVDGRKGDVVRARVEYHQIGDQAPYFSITGEVYGTECVRGEKKIAFNDVARWLHSCGCQHEMIAKVFPELAPFIKWHLSAAAGPMHYIANAVYFAQIAQGIALNMRPEDTREQAIANFRSTVVLDDAAPLPECMTCALSPNAPHVRHTAAHRAYAQTMRGQIAAAITVWCEDRLPALRDAFMHMLIAARALEGKL
jgi:hypothetical protein